MLLRLNVKSSADQEECRAHIFGEEAPPTTRGSFKFELAVNRVATGSIGV